MKATRIWKSYTRGQDGIETCYVVNLKVGIFGVFEFEKAIPEADAKDELKRFEATRKESDEYIQ